MKNIWAVILAAGSGTRLSAALGGMRKQYLLLDGAPLYFRSAETFSRMPDVRGLVFVFPPQELDERRAELQRLAGLRGLALPFAVAPGGARRQDSVRSGLDSLPTGCEAVLVHDAARPFFSSALTVRVVDALRAGADGAVPAIAVTDTIKRLDRLDRMDGADDLDRMNGARILETLVRSELAAVQTPQGFPLDVLRRAHAQADRQGWEVTDDASMVERLEGCRVVAVAGEESNRKITTPEDLAMLTKDKPPVPVTGWGYDVHRYGGDRPLVLGGVPIPGDCRVVAHSDGDVLLHALADAILGTCAGGDIGLHFPDTDPAWAGVASGVLVREALVRAQEAGVELVAVDLTVIAQVPRLAPFREQIARGVAGLLDLDPERVNVKATTEEKLGFTGEKKGIKAVACVSALRRFGPRRAVPTAPQAAPESEGEGS